MNEVVADGVRMAGRRSVQRGWAGTDEICR